MTGGGGVTGTTGTMGLTGMMTGGGGGGLTVTGPPVPGPVIGGKNADAVWVVRVNAAAPTAAVGIILNNRAGMCMAFPLCGLPRWR